MADHITSKLNPDSHLILDQPLIRLPFELLRKNFKVARFNVEKESTAVQATLAETIKDTRANNSSPDEVLKNVDAMLARMKGLKRKLQACQEEENRLYQQSQSRIKHLGDLYSMQSLDDVKYEQWSRTRLDRLLVDYMLRHGYKDSAMGLSKERHIEDLVDVETFVQMSRIRESLRNGKATEALTWCNENKKDLRKMDSDLEFMLRLQQYIELVRSRDETKIIEALTHAKKHLVPWREQYPDQLQKVAGLLAFPPGTPATEYAELYSPNRWTYLANLFMTTHNTLLALPSVPLLHIALSSGLSALKTPACHSSHGASTSISPTSSSALTTSVCPICSTELNELARNVPYAHHTKSHVESDLVLLPNLQAYGRARLEEFSRKAGVGADEVKDLRTGETFRVESLKKVYIS